MSFSNPILVGGGASNQSIWESVTTPRQPIGTVGELSDGRRFIYARSAGAALAAGKLVRAGGITADMDLLAVNTAAVGDTTLSITPTGTATYAANELVGGYVFVEDNTGEGNYYRILGNAATTAATEFVVRIEPLRVALAAASTVGIFPNPASAVVISATGVAQKIVGVPNFAVGAGTTDAQYFWVQTYGPTALLVDETVTAATVGQPLQPSAAVAGAAEPVVDAAAVHDPVIGHVMSLAPVNGDYAAVFLNVL